MYFQNPFDQTFDGTLLLSDRQYNVTFRVKGNTNTQVWMTAWNQEPYNLTSTASLTLNYSFDAGKNYTALTIDVTTEAASVGAVMAFEIAAALNADATFSTLYNAYVTPAKMPAQGSHASQTQGLSNWLVIESLQTGNRANFWKTYISNTGAEQAIRFNKKAGVAELPAYFSRHTIANANNYPDSLGMLVELSNPPSGFDITIINDAGFEPDVTNILTASWTVATGASAGTATYTTREPHGLNIDQTVAITGIVPTGYIGTTVASITSASSFTITTGTNNPGSYSSGGVITPSIYTATDWELLRGRSGLFNFQKITVDASNRITQIIEYPAGAEAGDMGRKIDYTYTGVNTHPDQITEIPYVVAYGDLVTPP